MKKLVSKLRRNKQPQEPAGRITTDTLAEHREKVLAGGRKFKYPVQYARHRLVFNAIIIAVAAIALVIGVGGWLLYQGQNTSDLMYRVTKVVPVPVAVIDGQQVRYSDYLMKYRSQVHYLVGKEQIDITSDDGVHQLNFIKGQAMDDAVADAYATKLAKELDVEVTNAELEAFLKQQRQSDDGEVSEATYNAVILEYYGWSPSEYYQAMKTKLLRQKVSYAVDTDADKLSKAVESSIAAGNTDLSTVANTINGSSAKVTYWPAAWVPKTNQDGGLAVAAAGLQKGQVSKAIKSSTGDGFYYVKLVDSNDTQVQYEYIQVPLTIFEAKLAEARDGNKLTTYITIPELTTNE